MTAPEQWDASTANILAAEKVIEPDATYWQIHRSVHNCCSEHRVVPDVRQVVEFLAMEQGFE